MLWPDEVRRPEFAFLDEEVEVRPQELAMAGSLIETLSGEFDPSAYKDSYREALQAVIEAKVAGREVVQPSQTQPTAGTVVDLMAALRASVAAAKKGRPPSTSTTDSAPSSAAPSSAAPSSAAPSSASGDEQTSAPATATSARSVTNKPAAKKTATRSAAKKAGDAGPANKPAAKRTPARRSA